MGSVPGQHWRGEGLASRVPSGLQVCTAWFSSTGGGGGGGGDRERWGERERSGGGGGGGK